MLETMRLPDMMLTHGLVAAQRCPLRPGVRYVVDGSGRECVYVGPHQDKKRGGAWSGKVRILYTDTKREGVVKPGLLMEGKPDAA